MPLARARSSLQHLVNVICLVINRSFSPHTEKNKMGTINAIVATCTEVLKERVILKLLLL